MLCVWRAAALRMYVWTIHTLQGMSGVTEGRPPPVTEANRRQQMAVIGIIGFAIVIGYFVVDAFIHPY